MKDGIKKIVQNDTKFMYCLVLGIITYLILYVLYNPFLGIIGIDLSLGSQATEVLCFIIYQIVILSASMLVMCSNFKKDLKDFKTLFSGILVLVLYFVWSQFSYVPLQLLGVDIENMSMLSKTLYLSVTEIFLIGLIIYILRNQLEDMLKSLKKNHREYFHKYFKYWFLILGIMYISNFVIMIITEGGIANNEQAVRDTFKVAPIYTYVSAVMFAPLLEELTFRQGIRNLFQNKWLFIIVSGFVFGGLHVFSSAEVWTDYLYLIPYCAPGMVFAYLHTKTNNVFVPMAIHFVHNGILMSLQVLLLLLS